MSHLGKMGILRVRRVMGTGSKNGVNIATAIEVLF